LLSLSLTLPLILPQNLPLFLSLILQLSSPFRPTPLDTATPTAYLLPPGLTDRSVGRRRAPMTPVNPNASPKRTAIVEAAGRVFAEHGLARARMADIAAAADVGKGTVYEYFKSKEDLVYAVLELHDQQVRSTVLEGLHSDAGARETLQAMFTAGARAIREHVTSQPMYMDFWAASRGGPREQEFAEFCDRNYRSWREIVAGIIRRGQADGDFRSEVDPNATATSVVAAFDGLGLSFYFDRTIDLERVTASLLDVLCDGLTDHTPRD
jgi:AcrR family transcriptional regulator